MQGSPVMVRLQVGCWRCGNGRCERKIFTERVPELARFSFSPDVAATDSVFTNDTTRSTD
jgi:hypothetical protein